jgi:uncharacterized RDD family membrane protein YckC
MSKSVCHVCNLQASSLSGHASEADAIAKGGQYLDPDANGEFDAFNAHDLCVVCANCGSVVTNPPDGPRLVCADCGQNEFYVVQTVAAPSKRPSYSRLTPPSAASKKSARTESGSQWLPDAKDSLIVSPWARWAARTVDFALGMFLGWFILLFAGIVINFNTVELSGIWWCLVLMLSGLIVDAVCYSVFDQTPGKCLFAVKIRRQNGESLGFRVYLMRNLLMFAIGLGLCIPAISQIAQLVQYKRLKSGRLASYDERLDVLIVRTRHGAFRTFVGIVTLVLSIVLKWMIMCGAIYGSNPEASVPVSEPIPPAVQTK